MGGHVSKNNTRGTSSGINLNANNMATELISYVAACKLDSDLQSFDSLRQVIKRLGEMNQDVVKVILDCNKVIWNKDEFSELVEEYFESSRNTMDFYIELVKCLRRASDSQLPVLKALQQLDEETEEVGNTRYARTLQELKNLKAAGDPFTKEFFQKYQSVYDQQKRMLVKLELMKNKLEKKLKYVRNWKVVWSVVYAATVANVLICSFVAAAVGVPGVAGALPASIDLVTGLMEKLKNDENALKGQKEVIITARARTLVAITDLENIRVLVDWLKLEIESLLKNGFAIEQKDVKDTIEEIKKKLEVSMKKVKELEDEADECCLHVMEARKAVGQRITAVFSGQN